MSEDRSHGDDRIGERDEEFLWSGTGQPSDELVALEQQVRALAPAAPLPRLPGRRRALGMALLAGATAAGMAALLVPARALPARWIARVVPGLSSELAVTGGARVRWRAVPEPGATAQGWREHLAARIERQGASRVDIAPDGLVTADFPGAARAEADAWARAAQGPGRLEVRAVDRGGDHPADRAAAPVRLDGGDVAGARVVTEGGRPGVRVELTPSGARRLEQLTEQAAGRNIAIAVDGDVVSTTVVKPGDVVSTAAAEPRTAAAGFEILVQGGRSRAAGPGARGRGCALRAACAGVARAGNRLDGRAADGPRRPGAGRGAAWSSWSGWCWAARPGWSSGARRRSIPRYHRSAAAPSDAEEPGGGC